jgi:DNA-binding transcriptional MerR regulator
MRIGNMAKRTGLTPDAIRFYERKALLPHPPRTPGGFRQFSAGDLEILVFIRQAQALGFTLKETRELLTLRRTHMRPCAMVRQRLQQKLADVCRKLAELRALERDLRQALKRCDSALGRRPARCPLLPESAERKAKTG